MKNNNALSLFFAQTPRELATGFALVVLALVALFSFPLLLEAFR